MDILSIMDLAAEVEDRAALLYHNFSRRFRTNPQGYAFWETISLEEKRHADMVRTYRRRRPDLPVCSQSHSGVVQDLTAARDFALGWLQKENESIGEALRAACRLEEMLAHAHLDWISGMGDPLLTMLMNKLGHEDRQHLDRVRRMASAFPFVPE